MDQQWYTYSSMDLPQVFDLYLTAGQGVAMLGPILLSRAHQWWFYFVTPFKVMIEIWLSYTGRKTKPFEFWRGCFLSIKNIRFSIQDFLPW